MKKIFAVLAVLVSVCFLTAWNKKEPASTPNKIRTYVLSEMQSMQYQLNAMPHQHGKAAFRTSYHLARKNFKHIEFFIEYYSTLDTKLYINGPLVPKYDPEWGADTYQPQGFQRIEELLYTGKGAVDTTLLFKECRMLSAKLAELSAYYQQVEIQDGRLLEMCQLELVRIAAMNLSGYDETIAQTNVTEALYSLEGIEKVIGSFVPNQKTLASYTGIKKTLIPAKAYLLANPAYNSFNRLFFITRYIDPLNTYIVAFHNASGLPWETARKQALVLNSGSLFNRKSFNERYFSMYYNDTLRLEEQAAIGKKLFSDPILSGNNAVSCSTCHNPAKAFTDGLPTSKAFDGENKLSRNAPTLFNVAFQRAFFHDARVYQLEQQVHDVVHNGREMNSSLEESVTRLKANEHYVQAFKNAFKGTPETSITTYAIQKVLTEYEKTLVSFNSKFDKYLNGDFKAMNAREINGYNIFAGKGLCGSCHFLPLFNGTVPPYYSDSESEVIGVAKTSDNKELDDDLGHYEVTHNDIHKHAFKTPTLRNIALTAPYMHNGAYQTLEQIVDFYQKGGGAGLGLKLENQTLPFDSLQLSKKEKQDIVLFLKTLTGE